MQLRRSAVSNSFKYFLNNFEKLGLKELIATCYQNDKADLFSQHKSEKGIYFKYRGDKRTTASRPRRKSASTN